MSMLSSCTLTMSLAPAGKFSPAALQLRTKQPAAAAAAASSALVLALPRAAPRVVSRALRLVCHAYEPYDILPTVMLNPSVGDHGNWKINEDKHHITLEFDVGEETKAERLSVRADKDHEALWLVFSYKGDNNSPATMLNNVRLQMPPGYEEKNVIKAEILPDGWLQIIIAKPKKKIGQNVPSSSKNIFEAKTDEKTSSETPQPQKS